jgi:hypothetical protein
MKKEERTNRIIARGEISDHAHVIVGDAKVDHQNNEIMVEVFGEATIKHILESQWVEEGVEVWTKEHEDIPLSPGKYKYVPQIEYDPYEDEIRKVRD